MELPLFPLQSVLFPGASLPLRVFELRYRLMITECLEKNRPFGVVLIREGEEVGDAEVQPHSIGCVARITKLERLTGGRFNLVAVGEERFVIRSISRDQIYLTGEVDFLEEVDADSGAAWSVAETARERYVLASTLTLRLSAQWAREIPTPRTPAGLADHIASQIELPQELKQRLLEELSVPRRLSTEIDYLNTAIMQLERKVKLAYALRYATPDGLN